MTKKEAFIERMKQKKMKRVEEWIPEDLVPRFREFARSLREAHN